MRLFLEVIHGFAPFSKNAGRPISRPARDHSIRLHPTTRRVKADFAGEIPAKPPGMTSAY
jgi:hypothetical protein